MARQKSDIVFGSEFSPAVIKLEKLLELVDTHIPDRAALQAAIDAYFFPGKGKCSDPRKSLADNTILSMCAYGILERDEGDKNQLAFTVFGRSLHAARANPKKLREMMGKHCLVECRGLQVIEAIKTLFLAGTKVTKENLAKHLRQEGLHIPSNGKHLNVLRQWLEYSGALNPDKANGGQALWKPCDTRIEELLGVTAEELEKWGELTQSQYDFARAFALLDVDEALSSRVRDHAIALYGTEFPEGGLPQSVLHKLQDVGLIEWEKTTGGRGAKAHVVRPTNKLRNEFLEPILEQIASSMGSGYKRLSRMSLTDILERLDSDDTYEKGIALEGLAFYFCRRLDLEFVDWRLRGAASGGAEVDMIVEGARLLFSRWQIQCKNTKKVHLNDLAKEVGIAVAMKSNVVMLISTGVIGTAVTDFARMVMQSTAIQVVLIGGGLLDTLKNEPDRLSEVLNQKAVEAMQIKRVQVTDNGNS
ncbi:MAG: hypothetical protein JXA11_03650 [Phycisphaerae bacterium]|nr:hypothetical protein [Phycisphaerae bacterium]